MTGLEGSDEVAWPLLAETGLLVAGLCPVMHCCPRLCRLRRGDESAMTVRSDHPTADANGDDGQE